MFIVIQKIELNEEREQFNFIDNDNFIWITRKLNFSDCTDNWKTFRDN